LRTAVNAPHRWIAETLMLGAVSSFRAYLSQTGRRVAWRRWLGGG
jgi:hypothetical protein